MPLCATLPSREGSFTTSKDGEAVSDREPPTQRNLRDSTHGVLDRTTAIIDSIILYVVTRGTLTA